MEKKINYITFKIDLTETSISVSTIDKNKKEELIALIPGIQTYPINIKFDKNEIKVCQQNTNENTMRAL